MENQNFDNENTLSQQSDNLATDEIQTDSAYSAHTVPLAAMIDERKKFQKQLEEERSMRQSYENILSALGQDIPKNFGSTDSIKLQYESILKNQGEAAANLWANEQLMKNQLSVQSENQAVLLDVQEKYKEIYTVPEVKQAIDAYLKLDVDPGKSLAEQGFPEAMEYISSIYKAGYQSALNLKSQNDAAKSRMGSSVTVGMPSLNLGKTFSRTEIAAMDPETFAQNEKAIFDQMAKGLIK